MSKPQNRIAKTGDFRSTLPAQVLTMAALLQQLAQGMDFILTHMGDRFHAKDAQAWRGQTDEALALFEPPKPLRVVVDISGGALNGVSCRQPVEIVFVSHDPHDLDDEQTAKAFVSEHDDPVALWQQSSEATERDGATVRHYFDQWAKAGPGQR